MGENVRSIPILASQPNLPWVTLVKTPHCGAGQTAVDGNQSGGKFADAPLFQITVFNWIIAVFDWIIGGCGSLFAGDLDGRDYLRKRMLPSAQICGRKIWAIQRDLNRWITESGKQSKIWHLQGVPKKFSNRKKIISNIEHCGAKFYHVHYLGGLEST